MDNVKTTKTSDDTKIFILWVLTPWLLVLVLTTQAQCSHCNYANQAPYHLAPVAAVNVFTNSIFRFSTLGKYSATLLPPAPQTPACEGYTSSQGESKKWKVYQIFWIFPGSESLFFELKWWWFSFSLSLTFILKRKRPRFSKLFIESRND